MRNLIERFRKNDIRKIFKIGKISSKSMRDILRPIYILNNIFGLRVFEFQGHPKPTISFLYSTTFWCLHSSGTFYREKWNRDSRMYKLDGSIYYIITIIHHIVLLVILTMGLYRSEESKLCVKKINEIDRTLQALGSSTSFNNIYKRTIMNITIIIVYLFVFFTLIILEQISKDQTMYKLSIIYLSMFLHIYSFMIEFLLVIEFCTIIRCIKFEFQRANKLLEDSNVQCSITKELIEQREPYGSLSIERSLFVCSEQLLNSPSLRQTQSRLKIARHKINSNKTLLRTIRQIHLELYRVSKRFSNMYGIQISLEIGMCVILVIFVLYRFYAKYRAKTYDINELIFEFINIIFLCLQYTIKIFIINYICDKTRNEAERTNEIIHAFNGENMDHETLQEVEIFSLQMMQCRNPYSAYGLYNLNCKHICSCIGMITTYMVIMIQVTDSIKKDDK